jgi:hypothetical protein
MECHPPELPEGDISLMRRRYAIPLTHILKGNNYAEVV